MSWHSNRKNDADESQLYYQISSKFFNWFYFLETLYDSRSLFRIFKSLVEIKRIQFILECARDTDRFTLITNVTSRFCYFNFWLFDNLYILTKVMNKHKNPTLELYQKLFWRISRSWWLCGIIMFLIYCLKTLRKTYTDESDLKVAALNKMTVRELKENT